MKVGIIIKVLKENIGKLTTGEIVISNKSNNELKPGCVVTYTEEKQTMAYVRDELGCISYDNNGMAKLKNLAPEDQPTINRVQCVYENVEHYVETVVLIQKLEAIKVKPKPKKTKNLRVLEEKYADLFIIEL